MPENLTVDNIVSEIQPIDRQWIEKAKQRTSQLVMPTRALGRLHDISEAICGIRRTLSPTIQKKAVLIMAGDHGVVEEGVSAYPREVTGAMIQTFLSGGAGINAVGRHVGAQIRVVDMGVIPDFDTENIDTDCFISAYKIGNGTGNLATGPAMSRTDAQASVVNGFKAASTLFDEGIDILGTGDMGIGNTTPSAAIGVVITGSDVDTMVGRGTGVDDDGLKRKKDAVARGVSTNKPDPKDGIDILAGVGGFEIGGIAGSILAAGFHRRPVVVDGFISTAGALIATTLCPTVKEYIFAGHCSAESGHRRMLEYLDLQPILDLEMRLGEGTGAALAMSVIEGALKVFKEVMTFEEAGVPDK